MRVPDAEIAWDLAVPSGDVHSRVAVTGMFDEGATKVGKRLVVCPAAIATVVSSTSHFKLPVGTSALLRLEPLPPPQAVRHAIVPKKQSRLAARRNASVTLLKLKGLTSIGDTGYLL
jgi:hypothetical protein